MLPSGNLAMIQLKSSKEIIFRSRLTDSYFGMRMRVQVQQAIELLEDENEKMVLTLRYLRNWKWEQIACEIGVGWTRIHMIHSNALKKFRILENKY